MTQHNDEQLSLPERVSNLERELPAVRRDATDALNMARVLDRDVSELQYKRHADTQILMALRETQIEHSQEFKKVHRRFDTMTSEVNGAFANVYAKLGILGAGMEHITELLTTEMNRRGET